MIVTLAFGVGVNTTMFSLVNAILFQPMHARNPEQIVAVFSSVNHDAPYGSSSYLDYLDIRDRTADVFQYLAAFTLSPVDIRMGEKAEHLSAGIVSGNYFRFLGVGALLGRTFLPEEDRLFDPRRVAILSERMWRERFSSDPAITGKTIRLNKQGFTVIGIMDARFCRLRHFFEVDLFVPASAKDLLSGQAGASSTKAFTGKGVILDSRASVRVRPVSFFCSAVLQAMPLGRAQNKLRLVAFELHRTQPDAWSDNRGEPGTITVVSEPDSRVPPQARLGVIAFSIFLLAIVGTVLLIACTNLANLSLARGTRPTNGNRGAGFGWGQPLESRSSIASGKFGAIPHGHWRRDPVDSLGHRTPGDLQTAYGNIAGARSGYRSSGTAICTTGHVDHDTPFRACAGASRYAIRCGFSAKGVRGSGPIPAILAPKHADRRRSRHVDRSADAHRSFSSQPSKLQ